MSDRKITAEIAKKYGEYFHIGERVIKCLTCAVLKAESQDTGEHSPYCVIPDLIESRETIEKLREENGRYKEALSEIYSVGDIESQKIALDAIVPKE